MSFFQVVVKVLFCCGLLDVQQLYGVLREFDFLDDLEAGEVGLLALWVHVSRQAVLCQCGIVDKGLAEPY